jgi:hypothetical protein
MSLLVAQPALAWGGGGKPNEYEPAAMATVPQLAAQAKKYWKATGLKKIRESGYSKAAILEFSVEYVTLSKSDWTGHGNFGLLDIAQKASGAGKFKTEIDAELKKTLPRELHDAFRQQLIDSGYEVATLEEVVASPAFAELKGSSDPGKDTDRTNNAFAADKKEKAEVYPVDGLMNVKMGVFAITSNLETMAQIASQTKAQVLVRAHFRVGVIKGGRPTLEDGSWIWVGAGPQASPGLGGNERHSFSQVGQLDAKDGFVYNQDVTDERDHKGAKGTIMVVNSDAYRAALLKMFPAFAGMGITLLDSAS